MPPKAAGKGKKGKADVKSLDTSKGKAETAKKGKKDHPEIATDTLEPPPEEPLALVLSSHGLSPFDRVVANAELVIRSLVQQEKHLLANQVSKLIDYCTRLKEDLGRKENEFNELLPKINEANDRMTQALNVSLTSEQTVKGLQAALENAWREIDASRLREQAMQEQMGGMYGKIKKEGKTKSTAQSDTMGELADAGPLANKKETILRERDRLQAEVEELEKRLQMQRLYSENVEKYRLDAEVANQALVHELESSDTNKTKSKRLLDDLSSNLEKARDENMTLLKKITSLETKVEEVQNLYETRTHELQTVRLHFEKLKTEQSSWNKILMSRSAALNSCTQENKSLMEQLRAVINKLKAKEYELSEVKVDCKKSIANYDLLTNRLAKVGNTREALGKDITVLKNEIVNLQKECGLQMKKVEEERHDKEVLIHERDALRGTIAKLTNLKKDLEHSLVLKNNTIERLQDDIVKKSQRFDELKQGVDIAVRERDRNAQEIEMLHNKVDDLQESVTLKAEQISGLKNLLVEKQSQFIRIKQNLESTNSERLILRQHLQTCTEEKDRNKTQLSHVAFQVSQLKEEITNHQNHIMALSLDIEKLNKEKQELKMEIRNKTALLNKVRNELKDTKKENDRLYKSLSADERRLMKQAIKLDNTEHEKDLIGSQMIRRNNEIMLLREQISILEIAMQRGQMQYNHRIEDIKLLKQEITRMRSQRNILTRGLANTADIRQEVLQLHRQLLQERITNSALKEESISPLNIHRWRPLAGRDPEKMELIRKIIFLQKRIICMQTQASRREKDLQQIQRLYVLLKDFIEKLPSYTVKANLIESQRILKLRTRKLKALTAELNAKDTELQTRDCTMEQLQSTLTHTKQVMNNLKKKEIARNDEILTDVPELQLPKTRTLGAGFKINCV